MATSCALRFNRSSFVGLASCDEISRKNDCLSGKLDDRSSSPADRLHRNAALSRFAVTIGKGYDDVPRRVGIVVDQPVTGFLTICAGCLLPSPSMRTRIISRASACAALFAHRQRDVFRTSIDADPCRVTVATSGSRPVSCAVGSVKLSGCDDSRELKFPIKLDVFDCSHLWRSSTIATS